MFMNTAQHLDKADNDAIVVNGNHWIISSKISTGRTESSIWILAGAGAD